MFDVAIASPLKIAFKQELNKRLDRIASADPEPREKAQIIRRVFVECFINALKREATPGNIQSGFQVTGFAPFNPQIPLESAHAVDPVNPGLFRTHATGTEVNEMILTSSEGLEFLCRHEKRRQMMDDDYRIQWRQEWERLKANSVLMGRALSEPPPLFLRGDDGAIRQIDVPSVPP
jgi:hypothetical protein